ncbi:MAG: riboflavin synthase [Candidatus Peregrinibacteria bacterium]
MFTGIVEATAKVTARQGGKLSIERPQAFNDVARGSSIAVAGVCLTVSILDEHSLTFDVMPETVAKTTIGSLSIGDLINVERALPAHGRFEGHVMQGHVEGIGEVVGLERKGEDVRLTIRAPSALRHAIIPKGSIALDGVSLTIVDVGTDVFTIALIPLTLAQTTLGIKRMGDHVNIETDILVRTLLAVGERVIINN